MRNPHGITSIEIEGASWINNPNRAAAVQTRWELAAALCLSFPTHPVVSRVDAAEILPPNEQELQQLQSVICLALLWGRPRRSDSI